MKKFFCVPDNPSSGMMNSFLHSGHGMRSPGCLSLPYFSRHLRQNVWLHGRTRGSVNTSVQMEHSVISASSLQAILFVGPISCCRCRPIRATTVKKPTLEIPLKTKAELNNAPANRNRPRMRRARERRCSSLLSIYCTVSQSVAVCRSEHLGLTQTHLI